MEIVKDEPENIKFLIMITLLIALAIYVFRFIWVFVWYKDFYFPKIFNITWITQMKKKHLPIEHTMLL